jgi:hypothetical protein
MSINVSVIDKASFVGKNNNFIEINGKRYNATTGAVLASTTGTEAANKHVDGIVAVPKHTTAVDQAHSAQAGHTSTITHTAAQHATAHKPEASHMLMRKAVTKPSGSLKRQLRAQTHTGLLAKQPTIEVSIKPSAQSLDSRRLQQAKHIPKSPTIAHFVDNEGPTFQPSIVSVPRPVPRPAVAATRVKPHTTAELMERALQIAQAPSSKPLQPESKRKKFTRHQLAIPALVIALLFVGALSIYQNMNVIRLHLASSAAGFSASLPAQQPAGYSLVNMAYSTGQVAIQYQSNSDQRRYSITEKPSDWDSATLLESFVITKTKNYQALNSGGRTIYVYGQDNATWVSGGVWYQVQSDGSLDYHQLITLAASL